MVVIPRPARDAIFNLTDVTAEKIAADKKKSKKTQKLCLKDDYKFIFQLGLVLEQVS